MKHAKVIILATIAAALSSCISTDVSYTGAAAGHIGTVGYNSDKGISVSIASKSVVPTK